MVQLKGIQNLTDFARQMNKKCRLILFYLGKEYQKINQVEIIPVAEFFKRK